jgi:8-oxo-dGTP pyrophosphatase MutT (NUDIX family)
VKQEDIDRMNEFFETHTYDNEPETTPADTSAQDDEDTDELKPAAGIMYVTPDNVALFLKRGSGGDHAGEWCWPGGGVERGESAEDAAVRESREEIGMVPKGKRVLLCEHENEADGVHFTTFVQSVGDPFKPTLNDEHTAYSWAPLAHPPQPLHPGAQPAISQYNKEP